MIFNPVHLIQKKRNGEELNSNEIEQFIQGITHGSIPDYQASAFLMAVFFQGMTTQETVALTTSMLKSGRQLDLSHIPGAKVDKHSTGGVGDKVSIILAPLAASCGLIVPMMAGRGLGHSGGTIDKLESIKGYEASPSPEVFERILATHGTAIIGQSKDIAPADKKLYALRDVTATVECIPLIVASILSKKLAEGTQGLVMDVKYGNGAFMKTKEKAKKLGKALIQVAKAMKLPCRVMITNMDQPLGYSAGNTLEILECVEIMKGEKNAHFSSADLKEITLQLCAQMLQIGKKVKTIPEGRKLALSKLNDGSCYRKFVEMLIAQGVSPKLAENLEQLKRSQSTFELKSKKRGIITGMNTEALGQALVLLGGGRLKTSDSIDFDVGFWFHRKLGDKVNVGDTLITLHYNKNLPDEIKEQCLQAISIQAERKPVPKLILDVML